MGFNKIKEALTFLVGMSIKALSKRLGVLLRDNPRKQKMKLKCNSEMSSREKKKRREATNNTNKAKP